MMVLSSSKPFQSAAMSTRRPTSERSKGYPPALKWKGARQKWTQQLTPTAVIIIIVQTPIWIFCGAKLDKICVGAEANTAYPDVDSKTLSFSMCWQQHASFFLTPWPWLWPWPSPLSFPCKHHPTNTPRKRTPGDRFVTFSASGARGAHPASKWKLEKRICRPFPLFG